MSTSSSYTGVFTARRPSGRGVVTLGVSVAGQQQRQSGDAGNQFGVGGQYSTPRLRDA